MTPPTASRRAFVEALALNAVWINASEVWRYFVVVKPRVARDFAEVPGIVPNTPAIMALWAAWDTLLIGVVCTIFQLVLERRGTGAVAVVSAATLAWTGVFGLLWLGLHNMGLATPTTAAVALPLAWLEMLVAAQISAWRLRSHATPR